MDKLVAKAFEKMQKREHLLRGAIDRRGRKWITLAQFKEEEKAILGRYALTEEEQSAYDLYNKVTEQRKRN